ERKRALEHRQAADTDDRVDLAGLDDRGNQGGPFGDENGVAEPLGLFLHVLDRAEAAALAEQAELIERRRTLRFDAQALRQQQQTALVGNAREDVVPRRVADQHGGIVAIQLRRAGAGDHRLGVLAQLANRHRRHRTELAHVAVDERLQPLAFAPRLRDRDLRRTLLLHRQRARKCDPGDVHWCSWGSLLAVSELVSWGTGELTPEKFTNS